MRKKKTANPSLITTDSVLYQRMKDHIYKKRRLFEEDNPLSELLQGMIDTMLEGEMDSFMDEEQVSSSRNKRNGKTQKKVLTELDALEVTTPRDRNGDFKPEIIGKR